MKKRIGFFGGSFDPIHFGHLNLAIQLFEIHKLDTVLFCPAYCSPFKTNAPPAAAPERRLAMLQLAIEQIPHFQISPLELDRKGPSYTIDTLRSLQSEKTTLHLLLSEDAAIHFDRWKDPEAILQLAPPLIGARRETKPPFPYPALSKGWTPTHIMDISSTEIRERLKKKLYCGHLIPAKALDYIHRHGLY
ncbi:MAG TPA: nicotinate (nicotinamide) nucleotide adenylyltransferase [Chlamydiales bacterium]|nr:nicotinate (nicotinamide) nucleotide adenylyltransferase [Chlamydiales bacterium]